MFVLYYKHLVVLSRSLQGVVDLGIAVNSLVHEMISEKVKATMIHCMHTSLPLVH